MKWQHIYMSNKYIFFRIKKKSLKNKKPKPDVPTIILKLDG